MSEFCGWMNFPRMGPISASRAGIGLVSVETPTDESGGVVKTSTHEAAPSAYILLFAIWMSQSKQ